ncbi:MAG TPA: TlpA disulfide reductase family protein [Candidatus Acidoferrum sp.]
MRIRMVFVLLLALLAAGTRVAAQATPNGSSEQTSENAASAASSIPPSGASDKGASGQRAFYASLTDPACPVTMGLPPIPTTNELRVLYFPTATGAVIREPKALVLHIAFDDGGYSDDVRTTEFTRRDDGVWQAQVTLRAMKNEYAIYWVEEPGTKLADTNGEKYFEVMFCDVHGERPEKTIEYQARTYDGWLETHGFDRPANTSKALQILEEHIRPPNKGESLILLRWIYKYRLGGETAETRTALLSEIRQFVRDHDADGFGLIETLWFVESANWVPMEFAEHIADVVEKKEKWSEDPHVELLVSRAETEKDQEKRLGELRELIARDPDSIQTDDARLRLFWESKNLGEREILYASLSTSERHRSSVTLRLQMAQAYLDAGTRYGIAMALVDDAEKMCDVTLKGSAANTYQQQAARGDKGAAEVMRAELLIRTGKPKQAVAVLLPRKSEFRRGHSFYVLGMGLEETGKRRDAIDAYMKATIIVGPDQQKANEAMERLWIKSKVGTKEQLRVRVEQQSVQAFEHTAYEPKLVSRTAPDFDLTTTGGEHFTSASLHGKPVVLNFWATWCGPCVFELKGLEEFQAKHPEIVVLTVVKDDTEPKDLQNVLKERHVSALRISKAPAQFFDEYGAVDVPHTFVIDESGKVRVHHFEGLEDATRYLEADFAAIREAGR